MIKFVTCKAYYRILHESEDLSGYDSTVLLKDIILDLFIYLLDNFNPYGAWDVREVRLLVRSTRPRTPDDVINRWAAITRQAICEEFGIPEKGWRLWLNRGDEFVRYIPFKEEGYEEHFH